MISSKKYIADGNLNRFLSDFLIKSELHVRVFNYVHDPINGSDTTDIVDAVTGLNIRMSDSPQSSDEVTTEKYDIVDNSIYFYNKPFVNTKVYIEVATTPEEFGSTISLPAVKRAENAADRAENAATLAEQSFQNLIKYYMGAFDTNPTTGMEEGTMYFNTVDKYIYIYDGTNWLGLNSMVQTKISIESFTILNGVRDFTLQTDFIANNNQLVVNINGVTQEKNTYVENTNNSITLSEDLENDETLEITVFENLNIDYNVFDYIDLKDSETLDSAKLYSDETNSRIYNVKMFGALGNSINDDTSSIQDAINACNLNGGGVVYIPSGTYMITTIFLKSNVLIEGEQRDSVILKSIAGTNADMIASYNYSTEDLQSGGVIRLQLNGNYFSTVWNDVNGSYNNTLGGGVRVRGYGLVFDIGIYNIAGIGFLSEEPHNGENSSAYHKIGELTIDGRDFGKEGIIIKGPNDWILKQAFIGRAGIMKRPDADTNIQYSAYYGGDVVNGIVLDGVNMEIGLIHVYANWSGTGFRTKNTCRLTNNGRVISESNRSQVVLSQNTYGSIDIDVRNIALYHPNWSDSIDTYSNGDEEWTAITNYSNKMNINITSGRTITSTKRVVGATIVETYGSSKINARCFNSTAPSGDAEAGSLYSGTFFSVFSENATIDIYTEKNNGMSCYVAGSYNDIRLNIKDNIGGSALLRNSFNNNKFGNKIEGVFTNCDTTFNSIGTPTNEIINLVVSNSSSKTIFTGDKPNEFNRNQIWNISGNNAGTVIGTRTRTKFNIDETITTEQVITIPHNQLFTPSLQTISFGGFYDASTVGDGVIEYCVLNSITSTDLVFKVKMKTASTFTTNRVVLIQIN